VTQTILTQHRKVLFLCTYQWKSCVRNVKRATKNTKRLF